MLTGGLPWQSVVTVHILDPPCVLQAVARNFLKGDLHHIVLVRSDGFTMEMGVAQWIDWTLLATYISFRGLLQSTFRKLLYSTIDSLVQNIHTLLAKGVVAWIRIRDRCRCDHAQNGLQVSKAIALCLKNSLCGIGIYQPPLLVVSTP